jgi:DNA-binding winged helix-turn-helix (wHTH) protein
VDPTEPKTRASRFGLFEADLEQRVLTKGGLRIKLQDQPFQVLALLVDRPGEIVTRDEIRQKLWSADTYVEFDDGLNTAIKKLRFSARRCCGQSKVHRNCAPPWVPFSRPG